MMEIKQVSGGLQHGGIMDIVTVLAISNPYVAALTIITPKVITALLTSVQSIDSKQKVVDYFNGIVDSLAVIMGIRYKHKIQQNRIA